MNVRFDCFLLFVKRRQMYNLKNPRKNDCVGDESIRQFIKTEDKR